MPTGDIQMTDDKGAVWLEEQQSHNEAEIDDLHASARCKQKQEKMFQWH